MAAIVTRIWPAASDPAGGQDVTIYGTGFLPGSAVTFGGEPATNVVVVSATEITCTTPAVAAGTVDVVVTPSGAAVHNLGNVTSFTDPTPALNGEKRSYQLTAFDINSDPVAMSELDSPMYNVPEIATGGTKELVEMLDGTFYLVHTFVESGTFELLEDVAVEYLIVGGGGGGGGGIASVVWGPGGGGGEVVHGTLSATIGNHPITVGDGGAASTGTGLLGSDGVTSSALGVAAIGGKGGTGNGGDGVGGASGSGQLGGVRNGLAAGGGAGDQNPGGAAPTSSTGGNGGDGRDMSAIFGTAVGDDGWFGGGGAGNNGGGTGTAYGGKGGGATIVQGTSAVGVPGEPNTGGGGAERTTGPGGSGIVILRYEVSFGFIHNTTLAHSADNVTLWNPPDVVSHDTVHAHSAGNLAIPPQTSLLRSLDSWHGHRANSHLFRFDFVLGAAEANDQYPGQVQFSFSLNRPVGMASFAQTAFSAPAVANAAQGLTTQGHDSLKLPVPIAGHGFYFNYLTFTEVQVAVLPIEFNFVESLGDVLVIHPSNLLHTAEQCNIGLRIPLTLQSSAHAHTADQVPVENRAVLGTEDALHTHSADEPQLRHDIPFQHIDDATHGSSAENVVVIHRSPVRVLDSAHTHTATQPEFRHTSPLAPADADHIFSDEGMAVRNWSLLATGSAAHAHSSDTISIINRSPLVIGPGWHYHRAQRLNFLPSDWVFRAVVTLPLDDRTAVVAENDRSATVELVYRDASVEATSRETTVPVDLRTASVIESKREATVLGLGEVSQIGG